jgi:hypothetical protein
VGFLRPPPPRDITLRRLYTRAPFELVNARSLFISSQSNGFSYDSRSSMHSVQGARSEGTGALELDFIHFIGVRTEVTAILLRGRNLTLALLVSAFVSALNIRDVIHSSPHSFEFCDSVAQTAPSVVIGWLLLGRLAQELSQSRLHARDFVFQSLRVGMRFLDLFAGLVDICW